MSSQQDGFTHSRMGAHGDRRQQPGLTNRSSDNTSYMHKLKKRSPMNTEVEEEEWNRRMQTWEKKRQRLSGCDWDRSFREAARARLEGKKPWRSDISSIKASLHKATRKSKLPENDNNCRSSTIESLQVASENFATNQAASEQKHYQQNKKRPSEGEISLEMVGLKRETSRMQLGVCTVAHSDGFTQSVPRLDGLLKVARNLKSNTYTANIKLPDVPTKTNDIASTRTNSLILADANLSSTRFIKTLLSPIQSESDCSKLGVASQSSDRLHIVEETADISVKNFRHTTLQSSEVNEEMAIDDTSFKPSGSIKERCSIKKIFNPDESNLSKKELMTRLSMPSEQSPVKMNLDENSVEVKFIPTSEVPRQISNQMNTAEAQPVEEESRVNHSSYQTTLQLRTNVHSTLDEKKAIKGGVETVLIQQPNSKANDYRDSSSGEPIVNQEFKRKNQQSTTLDENSESIDEKKSHRVTSNGNPTRNTKDGLLDTSNSRKRVKSIVEELPTLPPKSMYITIPKKKREDHGTPKETHYSCSSLAITCPSKERSSLHAIFSSPDTEIFGSRKKLPAQPLFIRTAFCEDEVPPDSQMVAVEFTSKEPFELRAKARPPSGDSLMLVDESWETLSTISGTWYKEFRHPVMSSEEFKSDVMKSDRYREIIFDRSSCRRLHDGPCKAKLSKHFENCCTRRYEVWHDTSACSMKNTDTKPSSSMPRKHSRSDLRGILEHDYQSSNTEKLC